jgi:hypothetical protein
MKREAVNRSMYKAPIATSFRDKAFQTSTTARGCKLVESVSIYSVAHGI